MREPLLPAATPEESGLRPEALARLVALIEGHVADGRYPGAQVALARHGKLAFQHSFGDAARAARPATTRRSCCIRTPRS